MYIVKYQNTYYGDITALKPYVKYHSDDQTIYPDILENYGILTDISQGTWVRASGGYFYKDSAPDGSYKVYCNMFTSKTGSVPRLAHSSGRIYIYNSPYTTVEELKAGIAGMNVLSLRSSASYTWTFVKRMSDNKFGYYCEAINTFFELYTDTGGTLSGDMYDHYMLKGAN